MHTRTKQKFVAAETALGARVPRAELFVLFKTCFRKCLHILKRRNALRWA